MPGGGQQLTVGYYNAKNCGGVEPIVRGEVYKALAADRSKGAALVRLFFHDCWVNGCDGSVLLNASQRNPYPEKVAVSNIGLRGFDVIEAIKARLESVYPGVVSCADIVAFAARDATRYLSDGHIDYAVPSGRWDGVVSRAKDADDTLPGSTFAFGELKKNFDNKKFTVEELVVLSGAHSIGVAHYPSFQDRLTAPQDEIDARYQKALRNAAKDRSRPVANDIRDESYSFKKDAGYPTAVSGGRDYLNNTYYHNALDNRVLFKSDWALRTDAFAFGKLQEYRDKPKEWDSDFADAMVKLSKLAAKGEDFEIRKKCSTTNNPSHY
ncbi:Peroxidase 2 [Dichanthelium oligosanthes]|uniref:Peroxidase n=1 Tax=Dichanthelium oligosanthes TaxID=888268 RepID=A0A1E5UKD7_9POAL|nr:Peroxidase 2 [Dichanthelium oligosanthes]